ncbi:MAG TPA: transcription antitermination factor NusB [Propionibacteriaceae bacterium]|nr:transcription antitermination factor NusB [Propionibacteriaceae bacterium]
MEQDAARPRTSARHKARKHALDLLFEADLRGTDPVATLEERSTPEATVRDLTAEIVRGVAANVRRIDSVVASRLAEGWTLERMPRVDRILARMATYELLYTTTEPSVVVSEAVRLASELSTDESPAFLNAVLRQVANSQP